MGTDRSPGIACDISEVDLNRLATCVCGRIRANPLKSWEDAYDDLWSDYRNESVDRLFGRTLADGRLLHGVDRKRLYALARAFLLPSPACRVTVPASVTGGAPVDVPRSWLTEELPAAFGAEAPLAFAARYGTDLPSALCAWSGKRDAAGRPQRVWQDYVAGTDPSDPDSRLRALVDMQADGPHVSCSPRLPGRTYEVWGTPTLAPADWHTPVRPEDRFFKVTVSLP